MKCIWLVKFHLRKEEVNKDGIKIMDYCSDLCAFSTLKKANELVSAMKNTIYKDCKTVEFEIKQVPLNELTDYQKQCIKKAKHEAKKK